MVDQKTTPLRARMIEDMRIKGLGESAKKAHIRAVRYLAEFLGRSPNTATEEDLRAYQLHMVDTNVTPSTYNARLVGLRFFFETTCKRPEMKGCMHFSTEGQSDRHGRCRVRSWRLLTSSVLMGLPIGEPTLGILT